MIGETRQKEERGERVEIGKGQERPEKREREREERERERESEKRGRERNIYVYSYTSVLPGPEIFFRPVHQKNSVLGEVRPIGQKCQFNLHMKGQFEMKLKFFFVSGSVSVLLNKEFH
jgi:hypothetical protein